ncbi:MAG: hypothetical protein RLY78_780 [Pseudomonadota bacterium]|jgi:hypothetical protein|uniref:Uncharacterized protein n=1 Tax=Pseudaquabacterium rugosum TaxID=2984194 RepID=A0ABU9B747_9BURK
MKTHTIEIQRIRALTDRHGLVLAKVDAFVQPMRPADGQDEDSVGPPASVISLSVEDARVLYQLLKKQFATIDGRKARSQR